MPRFLFGISVPLAGLPWLLLGGALQIFGFGKWIVPLAAWLAPVFLLRFTRSASPLMGLLGVGAGASPTRPGRM